MNYQELLKHYKDISVFGTVGSLLHWDMETMMPAAVINERSEQIELVNKLSHRMSSEPRFVEALMKAENREQSEEQAQLMRMKREILKSTALSEEFVTRISRVSVSAHHKWVEAKKQKDFSIVENELAELVDLRKEEADILAASDGLKDYFRGKTRYEIHLDSYEPGMESQEIRILLEELVNDTKKVLPQILEKNPKKDFGKTFAMSDADQKKLCEKISASLGLNFQRARLDSSAHPFCTNLYNDVRITTRYDANDFTDCLLSVVHETGHGLYEQNLPKHLLATPCGSAASMGVHESQSRFMENCIARSRAFSKFLAKETGVTADLIFQKLNQVEKTFIRVDSDEVSYNLHIYLRFLLEEQLIEGKIAVKDLPELWNEKFSEVFGLRVNNPSQGVLQDIHWYMGAFGYFPTYSIGNLLAAELFKNMKQLLPNWEHEVENGNFSSILKYLGETVHSQAALHSSPTTMKNAIGRKLGSKAFLEYIQEKYSLS